MTTADEIRDLEKLKLDLEILKLKRPFFTRPPFILALFSLLPSVLGNVYLFGDSKTANSKLEVARGLLDETNATLGERESTLDDLEQTIEDKRAELELLHAAYNEEKSFVDEALLALEERAQQSQTLEQAAAEYLSIIETQDIPAQSIRASEVKAKYDLLLKLDPLPETFDRNFRSQIPVLQIDGTEILVTPEVEKYLSPKQMESLVRNP